MTVFKGNKYHIYINDVELKNVTEFTVDGNDVIVDTLYAYNGFNGGDLLGVSSRTYDKKDVKVRRVNA